MLLRVHEFTITAQEDPEIYAAGPLYDWEHSEMGQWVMKNSKITPSFNIVTSLDIYGYRCYITADLEGEALTFFKLKWG